MVEGRREEGECGQPAPHHPLRSFFLHLKLMRLFTLPKGNLVSTENKGCKENVQAFYPIQPQHHSAVAFVLSSSLDTQNAKELPRMPVCKTQVKQDTPCDLTFD